MSIRWKFFTALAVLGLLPLLAVGWVNLRGTRILGETLVELSRENLTTMVSRELTSSAQAFAKRIRLERELAEFFLRDLADDTAQALQGAATPHLSERGGTPLFALDLARGLPEGFRTSPRYQRPGADTVVPVDFGRQLFFAPAGLDFAAARAAARRLGRLTPQHQSILRDDATLLFRIWVVLENGLCALYPAHGGYLPGFDARKRLFYRRAMETNAPLWLPPLPDPALGRLVLTASRPIPGPEGSPLGVAAVDVLIAEALDPANVSEGWADVLRVMLVIPAPLEEAGPEVLIVADSRADEGPLGTAETETDDVPRLELGRHEGAQAALHARLSRGLAGYMDIPVDGEERLVAFAPVNPEAPGAGMTGDDAGPRSLHVLLSVPKEAVMALPRAAEDTVRSLFRSQLLFAGVAVLAAIGLGFVTAFLGSRFATRPFFDMVEAWQRLARGDFSVRLKRRFSDERDQLVTAFNDTVPKLEDQVQLRRAMNMAQEIQQHLLPDGPAAIPGYDAAGFSRYSDETGGDYFDFFSVGSGNKHMVVVGDVSGHGLASALLMASGRALLKVLAEEDRSLAWRVRRVNRFLTRDVGATGRFMTLFCMELDTDRARVGWVRAGHDPALFYSPGHGGEAGTFSELAGKGLPLGISEDAGYTEQGVAFDLPGQMLVVGTDGIWEARNAAGEMFGKRRFKEVLAANANAASEDVVAAVVAALEAFMDGAPQRDDVTLVVVKRTARAPKTGGVKTEGPKDG